MNLKMFSTTRKLKKGTVVLDGSYGTYAVVVEDFHYPSSTTKVVSIQSLDPDFVREIGVPHTALFVDLYRVHKAHIRQDEKAVEEKFKHAQVEYRDAIKYLRKAAKLIKRSAKVKKGDETQQGSHQ